MALSIALLGEFAIVADDQPITSLTSNKARMLLAYLVMEQRQHQRSELAGLLWPDSPESTARTNLRHVLRVLRQSLSAVDGRQDFFVAGQQTLQLNLDMSITGDSADNVPGNVVVDVWRFHALQRRCTACNHAVLEECSACMARYREAAILYRGDLLADLKVDESDLFEEWAVVQRERLQRQALQVLFTLTTYSLAHGEYDMARRYAERQLQLAPWHEEAHRQLMMGLAQSGQRSAALAQFANCRQLLADELGVEPNAETQALYAAIRDDTFARLPVTHPPEPSEPHGTEIADAEDMPAVASPNVQVPSESLPATQPVPSTPRVEWADAPAVPYFYGRAAEVRQLEQWLLGERCRLVTILAMGGMGKTTLAVKVAHGLSGSFESVFWRSLINTPPLADYLQNALRFLSGQQLSSLPTTLDQQLTLLIHYLQEQRTLLILDNVESILEGGRAGHYRAGYEGYGQLIERIVQREHQSCLLLTSRERPHRVGHFEEDFPWVRSLTLDGLDTTAGHALLATRGVTNQATRTDELVSRYSGNPLALKLVARTIQDLFDGDIAAFLSDDVPIFDDIRTVLEQQFQRLTQLEREILIWLAIEREGIPLSVLNQNLVQSPTRAELLTALRSLQHRSLLEKTEDGFTLQNVVTEYITDHIIAQVCQEIEEATATTTALDQSVLHRHALSKAHSKEYIRQSQRRLLLEPICHQLEMALGRRGLVEQLQRYLEWLRSTFFGMASYAPGNILKLLLHLNVDLHGWNFSQLAVWQATLQGMNLQGVDFTGADFTNSSFTNTFNVVYALAYSPNGEWLAAGTLDGEIWLWRTADLQAIHVIHAHLGSVRAVLFHPDGETLISGGDDHVVRVWNLATGAEKQMLLGHNGWVRSIALSLDGALVASGSMDQTICIWQLATGELLHTLREHTEAVWGVAFYPHKMEHQLLASCSADYTVRLWDATTGQPLSTLTEHTWEVRALTFSPDGRFLASGGLDKHVCIWDVDAETGHCTLYQVLDGDTASVRYLAFSRDNSLLVEGGADYAIRLWETRTFQIRHTLYGHQKGINALAFAPNANMLISGSDDRTIRIWNPQSGQPRDTLHGHTGWVRKVLFHPAIAAGNDQSPPLIVSGSDDAVVRVWDGASGERLHALREHQHWIWSMAFSPNGAILATGGADHLLCLWDTRDPNRPPQLRHRLVQHTGTIRALAFNPTGDRLASGDAEYMIHLWDPNSGQRTHTLPGHTGWVNAVAFSPDGALLASASNDHTVRLWTIKPNNQLFSEQGCLLQSLTGHGSGVGALCFSPNGAHLATAAHDGSLYLWDMAAINNGTMEERCVCTPLVGHAKEINVMAFSPDGRLLASGSSDGTVRLWDSRSGRATAALDDHAAWVSTIAFAPLLDGSINTDVHLLASAGADQTIRLWEVDSLTGQHRLRHVLAGHEHWVWHIAFSPDGELLASAGVDKTVRVWETRTGHCCLVLRPRGPYTGMKITGATGISGAQRIALKALGAMEM